MLISPCIGRGIKEANVIPSASISGHSVACFKYFLTHISCHFHTGGIYIMPTEADLWQEYCPSRGNQVMHTEADVSPEYDDETSKPKFAFCSIWENIVLNVWLQTRYLFGCDIQQHLSYMCRYSICSSSTDADSSLRWSVLNLVQSNDVTSYVGQFLIWCWHARALFYVKC
jgi:hypothetical protein